MFATYVLESKEIGDIESLFVVETQSIKIWKTKNRNL